MTDLLFLEYIELLVMITLGVFFLWYYKRQQKLKKSSFDLLNLLDKNLEVLKELCRKHKVEEFKSLIELYGKFQMILKLSKADFISFFKYDYSKRFLISHFMFSITDKGEIVHFSKNPDLPVTANKMLLSFVKSDDKDLYLLHFNDISGTTAENVRDMYRGIKTMYYQNIYKDENSPFGYVVVSYKDENFILPEEEKAQILRILRDIKNLI